MTRAKILQEVSQMRVAELYERRDDGGGSRDAGDDGADVSPLE
jgi:hypothetical protein